jgi:hypothetical protein
MPPRIVERRRRLAEQQSFFACGFKNTSPATRVARRVTPAVARIE